MMTRAVPHAARPRCDGSTARAASSVTESIGKPRSLPISKINERPLLLVPPGPDWQYIISFFAPALLAAHSMLEKILLPFDCELLRGTLPPLANHQSQRFCRRAETRAERASGRAS